MATLPDGDWLDQLIEICDEMGFDRRKIDPMKAIEWCDAGKTPQAFYNEFCAGPSTVIEMDVIVYEDEQ